MEPNAMDGDYADYVEAAAAKPAEPPTVDDVQKQLDRLVNTYGALIGALAVLADEFKADGSHYHSERVQHVLAHHFEEH